MTGAVSRWYGLVHPVLRTRADWTARACGPSPPHPPGLESCSAGAKKETCFNGPSSTAVVARLLSCHTETFLLLSSSGHALAAWDPDVAFASAGRVRLICPPMDGFVGSGAGDRSGQELKTSRAE